MNESIIEKFIYKNYLDYLYSLMINYTNFECSFKIFE